MCTRNKYVYMLCFKPFFFSSIHIFCVRGDGLGEGRGGGGGLKKKSKETYSQTRMKNVYTGVSERASQ